MGARGNRGLSGALQGRALPSKGEAVQKVSRYKRQGVPHRGTRHFCAWGLAFAYAFDLNCVGYLDVPFFCPRPGEFVSTRGLEKGQGAASHLQPLAFASFAKKHWLGRLQLFSRATPCHRAESSHAAIYFSISFASLVSGVLSL